MFSDVLEALKARQYKLTIAAQSLFDLVMVITINFDDQ